MQLQVNNGFWRCIDLTKEYSRLIWPPLDTEFGPLSAGYRASSRNQSRFMDTRHGCSGFSSPPVPRETGSRLLSGAWTTTERSLQQDRPRSRWEDPVPRCGRYNDPLWDC